MLLSHIRPGAAVRRLKSENELREMGTPSMVSDR